MGHMQMCLNAYMKFPTAPRETDIITLMTVMLNGDVLFAKLCDVRLFSITQSK